MFPTINYLKLIVIICTLLLHSCQSSTDQDKTSGVLNALDFMYQQRAFPNIDIPADGFYKGYEHTKNEFRNGIQTRNEDTDPWEAIGPHNTAGRTLALAFNPQNPNTIYAGSASGGLWRSYQLGQGTSWEYVNTGFPVLGVSSIAIDPQDSMTMFIGTGEVYSYENVGKSPAYRSKRGTYGMGILKSEDGGKSWSKSLDWSYDQLKGVNAVELAPSNADIIYAATSDGVYKSEDRGLTWSLKLDVHLAMDVAVHPLNDKIAVAGCGNFGSVGKGIYLTTDGGESWSLAQAPIPTDFRGKILLDFSPSSPDVVYASIGNGFSRSDGATWLCRSDDAGKNWTVVNTTDYSIWQGWFAHDIATNPFNHESLIAVGIYIHKTLDAGQTLTQVTQSPQVTLGRPKIGKPDGPPTYTHIDHHVVRYHPVDSNIVLVGSDGGVFISFDGGVTYESRNGGYQSVQFYNGISVSPDSEDLMLGGLQDNSTAGYVGDKEWYRWVGGGGSWSAINPDNPLIQYSSWQNLNIVRSIDGFQSYKHIHTPENGDQPVFIAPYVLCPNQANILYGAAQKIYKTDDAGDNWIATNNGNKLANGHPFLCLAVSPNNCDVVFGGTAPFNTNNNKPKIFFTLDGGETWDEADNSTLPNRYPSDMTIAPDSDIVYVTYSGYGTGHLFKSEDYGSTWIDISNTLPDLPGNAVIVDPKNPSHIYFGNDIGVFISEDDGISWEDYSDGLQEAVLVMDLKISEETRKLFVGTHGNGAYKRDLRELSTKNTNLKSVNLIQVYPNPTLNKLIFDFSRLNQHSNIDLHLYNVNGQEIHRKQDVSNVYHYYPDQNVADIILYEILINGQIVKSGKVLVTK